MTAEKEKKKFADTKVGKFIKENIPTAMEVLSKSKIPLVSQITSTISAIGGLSKEKEAEFHEALQQYEEEEMKYLLEQGKEITERWKADMSSDSWLSKNVRPVVLLYMLFMITLFITLDSLHTRFSISDHWIGLIETLASLVFVAYFGGRTGEKIFNKNKQ